MMSRGTQPGILCGGKQGRRRREINLGQLMRKEYGKRVRALHLMPRAAHIVGRRKTAHRSAGARFRCTLLVLWPAETCVLTCSHFLSKLPQAAGHLPGYLQTWSPENQTICTILGSMHSELGPSACSPWGLG